MALLIVGSKLTLVIQRTNGGWRLGLPTYDSITHFYHRESVRIVLPGEPVLDCKCSCGTKNKKAFDFNSKTISNWIEKNKFNCYPKGQPVKLLFELSIDNKIKTLIFIQRV
jgi:hypothetical protein